METMKLYYEDVFMQTFDAEVLSCETGKGGAAEVLAYGTAVRIK